MSFKVTHVISSFSSETGGPPRVVLLFAAAGLGIWNSDLLTTDARASQQDILLFDQFPGRVYLLPSDSQQSLYGLRAFLRLEPLIESALLSTTPELLHIHGVWSLTLASVAAIARRRNIPFIVSPHGMLEPWSLRFHAYRKFAALRLFQGRILRQASYVHATSDVEARNLRSLGIAPASIMVVPNIVEEPADGLPTPPLEGTRRTLLFLSRIHPKKGIDLLLHAWKETKPKGWELLIVGSGERGYEESLKQFCDSHRLDDVLFRPHAEGIERERLFRRASAFILPSHSENFGLVVAEAMIRGLPVITTTGTPWSEVAARDCGWYVKPELSDIASALATATSMSNEQLAEMGRRARAFALANFTVPAVRRKLHMLYEAALARPPLRLGEP